MTENKTRPTDVSVDQFLTTASEQRRSEAHQLINIMQAISGEQPIMWGPSIIGFGSVHYRHDTGREGDMPRLGFSPRKASITVYFSEGFDNYAGQLDTLGKHTSSVSCLYINKLSDIDLDVLRDMLTRSNEAVGEGECKPETVDEYVQRVPAAAKKQFDELRRIVQRQLPDAEEVLSYGIVGYSYGGKRPRVYISGWKDHLAIYPVPKDESLCSELRPYIKSKGTLWLPLEVDLPEELISRVVKALAG